jgi:uncharacterized protein involved in type VI secretion and phage assembly
LSPPIGLSTGGRTESRDGKVFGVVTGLVTNNEDPENLGRVKLKFPWLEDSVESDWARVVSPMAGGERGFHFLPEVDDEVLVAFEHGDVHHPYVVGCLWGGKDKPPMKNNETVKSGGVQRRMIKTRKGHTMEFGDDDSDSYIKMVTSDGEIEMLFNEKDKKLNLKAGGGAINLSAGGDITLEGSNITIKAGGNLKLEASGIGEFKASGNLKLQASGNADLKAGGICNVKGAMVKLN